MAFKNLIAFGAGELTPELWERGNLDKFRTGLARLRNCTVTKMGGLQGRAGTLKFFTPKNGAAAKYVYIQAKNYLLEITNGNIRVRNNFNAEDYTFTSTVDISLALYPAGDDITKMNFTYGNKYLFLFADDKEALRIDLDLAYTSPSTAVSQMRDNVKPYNPWLINPPTAVTWTSSGSFAGSYDIDYALTFVYEGIETFISNINQTLKKPITTGEYNNVAIVITKASLPAGAPLPTDVRIYQRPRNAGIYGLVGVASNPVETATLANYTFRDYGVTPVFTDNPPEYVSQFVADTKAPTITPGEYFYNIKSKTGLVYQDRLIFSGSKLGNKVFGSRTGTTAMTRDFPLQDDSAVSFKLGSDGGLKIQRFFDGRGLLMFTTVGVYETPSELLTPETAYGIKRGPYVATDKVEPVQLGGFITIYEKRLKSIIGLTPSGQDQGYAFSELSIYSSHLLKGAEVVSWALQDGETQILWIVLDTGKVLSFSFQDEQMLRSWAWHDTKDGLVEEVFIIDKEGERDVVCFQVNRGGVRTVEALTARDASFKEYIGTDASVRFSNNILIGIASPTATVAPVTPGEWDGPLTITPAFTGFGESPGDVVRVYTSEFEYIDMEVTANTLGVLTVQPESEYPSSLATLDTETNPLWSTYTTLTGLSHLNGKRVSVRVDGFTHASPLNTEKNYDEYTVSSGSIILADGIRGAFISVGLPIVQDIQTLEVDTIEQSPTKLEGKIVNKLRLSYFESLFLYAGSELPIDDTITGMDNQEYQVEPDDGISNTIPPLPQSERLEMQIQGDWKVKGSVALRNVDPQPIALRAIIPDIEVIRN